MTAESVVASLGHLQYLENLLSLEAKALLRVSLKCIYTYTHVQMALFLLKHYKV